MPTYHEELLNKYKGELSNLFTQRPDQINAQIDTSRNYLDTVAEEMNQSVQGVTGRIASRYGLPVSTEATAGRQMDLSSSRKREQDSVLAFRRRGAMNKNLNQQYSYVLNKYLNAGFTLKQAEQFSQQWLSQQSAQQNASSIAADNRSFALERSAIGNKFEDDKGGINVDYGDPFEQAIMSGLGSLLPYGVYWGAKKTKAGSKLKNWWNRPDPTVEFGDNSNDAVVDFGGIP